MKGPWQIHWLCKRMKNRQIEKACLSFRTGHSAGPMVQVILSSFIMISNILLILVMQNESSFNWKQSWEWHKGTGRLWNNAIKGIEIIKHCQISQRLSSFLDDTQPLPRCKVHSGDLCGHNGVWSRHQDGPAVVTLWSTTCVKLKA